MYIITSKNNNEVIDIGNSIKFNEINQFPTLNGTMFYPKDLINIYNVKNFPMNLEPNTWYYNGENFYQEEEIIQDIDNNTNEIIDYDLNIESEDINPKDIMEIEFLENKGSFMP